MRIQHSRETQMSGSGIRNGVHYTSLARRNGKDDSMEVSEVKTEVEEPIGERSNLLKSLDSLGKFFPVRQYICSFVTASSSKLLIFSLILLSALILIIFRNQGENALLCKEVLSEKAIPYPRVDFQHVKARKDKGRYSSLKAANWIVVFVARDPTDEVRELAKLKGWQVLAIADSETAKDWSVPGVIFLSTEHQASLGYRINKYLPYSSYVRKNVGYLFAIQHGARKIYDLDEKQSMLGNDLAKFFDTELHSQQKNLLQYRVVENRTTVNPYIHFGQRSVWPRGLPLTSIPKISADIFYNEVPTGKQYIQQGLTKGLPDVDSIFYYTRRVEGQPINLEFDSHAPSLALPHGTMAPVNSMNTLFHYQAFWGLMLPVSTGLYASDTVRGYWSQRLLWEIQGMLAIYPPSMFRVDSMQPSMYEDDELFSKSWEELVSFLVSWKSNKEEFFQRVLDLSHTMGQIGFWSAQDVKLSAAWLKDLLSVGYMQPVLENLDLGKSVPFVVVSSFTQFKPHVFPAKYVGVQEASAVDKDMGNLLRWRRFYGNIVLIMECSWPLNHTVVGWRLLYGRIFKHVIILSQQADSSLGVEDGAGWQTYKYV
ncbi:hypothetical protein O6H91_Y220600 [Diphasiastrum complanatum]|nr:hypothetical protein O6H91_Y220600 [Diphasiastrum complanatum]